MYDVDHHVNLTKGQSPTGSIRNSNFFLLFSWQPEANHGARENLVRQKILSSISIINEAHVLHINA